MKGEGVGQRILFSTAENSPIDTAECTNALSQWNDRIIVGHFFQIFSRKYNNTFLENIRLDYCSYV